MFFDSQIKSECSGCTACLNVCPVSAIKMQEDEEGFLYPKIDINVCINCGVCRKVCSWENPKYDNYDEPLTFAAVLKDKSERQRSTSGGVFFTIASWVINHGGIVYGAAFDKDLKLHHISVDAADDLWRLRGSKYIQSSLDNVYLDVKEQLSCGRWCLFTGTGCQIGGLKSFLQKDYQNLITVDVVCHGVPSQKLFDNHIAYMENMYGDKVCGYQFRDLKKGSGCETCFFEKRRVVVNPSYELSPYLYSFMYSYTLRLSCYECKFAKIPRQGDITLADYWGIEKIYPDFDRNNGVSLIMINNAKGEQVWNSVKDTCTFVKSNIIDAIASNRNIIAPTEKPQIRNTIYKEIKKEGYAIVAKNRFHSPRYRRIKIEKTLLSLWIVDVFVKTLRKTKKLIFKLGK